MTDPLEARLRAFYGFNKLPFRKDFSLDEYFPVVTLSKVLERLRYLADRQGIGVLTCAPGTGKSTLLRVFLSSLSRTAYSTCYLSHTTCGVLDLTRQIAMGFDLAPRYRRADVLGDLKERLVKLSQQQRIHPVLVIDDAHLLPPRFLDELQILSSFDVDGRDELTLVLAGQPQLRANLALAVNEAFAQRVVLRLELEPWTPEEIERYLVYRLDRAGRTAKLFTPDAVHAITKAARGVPRLVDRVAECALLLALEGRHKDIDVDLVTLALEEVEL